MRVLEWIAARAAEALVLAVMLGSITIGLLAISGVFGSEGPRTPGGQKYPDHITRDWRTK